MRPSVVTGDFNGDRKPDIVTANYCTTKSNCNGIVAVLLNSSLLKTTTTLTSSPNPSLVGQPVTLTATMTSASSIPDGETVSFYHGSVLLGSSATKNGAADADDLILRSGELHDQGQLSGRCLPQAQFGESYAGSVAIAVAAAHRRSCPLLKYRQSWGTNDPKIYKSGACC